MTRQCKKSIRGLCSKNGTRLNTSPKTCPYTSRIDAALDCKFFDDINETSSSIVEIIRLDKLDDSLKCIVNIKTALGILKLEDIYLYRYIDGFLGYIVTIDEERGIKLPNSLEKELISQVRKALKT